MSEGIDWEININSKADAAHFCRIGGLAGFIYAIINIILWFIHILLNLDEMAEISLTERYIYLGAGVLYMLAFCFLSWRIFSHKGYISAVLMFFFFIVLSIFNFRLSILNVLLVGILGYGMYAGILGTFAYRRYQKTTDIAIFD